MVAPACPANKWLGASPDGHPRLDFFHLTSRFQQYAIYEELPIGCCTSSGRIERRRRVLFDQRARWGESGKSRVCICPRPRHGCFPPRRKMLPAVPRLPVSPKPSLLFDQVAKLDISS
jgi:hypothetical protein